MFKLKVTFLIAVILGGKAWGHDEFAGVRCGSDIPKALIGKQTEDQRVVVTEASHRDIGLSDLGGSEISNRLFLESWLICGSEFELLVNTRSDTIRDVLAFPEHSKSSPMTLGPCQIKGRLIPEAVVAILDNSAGYDLRKGQSEKTLLKGTAAWKIDEVRERFKTLPTKDLVCTLGGVVTSDGGP